MQSQILYLPKGATEFEVKEMYMNMYGRKDLEIIEKITQIEEQLKQPLNNVSVCLHPLIYAFTFNLITSE